MEDSSALRFRKHERFDADRYSGMSDYLPRLKLILSTQLLLNSNAGEGINRKIITVIEAMRRSSNRYIIFYYI